MGNVPLANDPDVIRLWRETAPHGLSLVVWYEQVYLPLYNDVLRSASLPGGDGMTWVQKNEMERQRDRERHQTSGSPLSYELWCVEQYQLGWEHSHRRDREALDKDRSAVWTTPRCIFDPPDSWKQLQKLTAQMFEEMGCDTRESFRAPLVRGKKEIDVYVEDRLIVPPQTYAVECKRWKDPVDQEVVHAFRTVCADSGVNTGFIVSTNGFQSGAHEAAAHTNVRLVSFSELQEAFFDRWHAAMMERLSPFLDTLFPYWDRPGRMPRFQWGLTECRKHEQLLGQYQIVLDAYHWSTRARRGPQAQTSRPLPCIFNDPQSGDPIEVSTHRQYFSLVSEAHPRMLRDMQLLHGEIEPTQKRDN